MSWNSRLRMGTVSLEPDTTGWWGLHRGRPELLAALVHRVTTLLRPHETLDPDKGCRTSSVRQLAVLLPGVHAECRHAVVAGGRPVRNTVAYLAESGPNLSTLGAAA